MKKYIIWAAFILAPFAIASAASSDYYLKLDGVKGETSNTNRNSQAGTAELELERAETNTNTNTTVNRNTNTSNSNSNANTNTSGGATVAAPAEAEKKGNVEMNWKVEEGEKSAVPGVEPDEIDVADDSEPLTPDFSILLGGGGGSDDSEVSAQGNAEVEKILLDGMQEQGAPAETLSLNYEKIKTTVKKSVRLFGFIPVSAVATIEIDASQNVKVTFPWWAAFASGKDKDDLGKQVFAAISNVLKTKHDTIKNSIGNIR